VADIRKSVKYRPNFSMLMIIEPHLAYGRSEPAAPRRVLTGKLV